MGWNKAFEFEFKANDWFDMIDDTIDFDEIQETYNNYLKNKTKNISFPVIKIFEDVLYILYFVECSNIQVKSMIHYELRKITEEINEIGIEIVLKQVGHNFC